MTGRTLTITAIVISVIMGGLAQLMLKNGLDRSSVQTVHTAAGKLQAMFINPRVLGGLAIYGLSTVFYLFALSREPLSFVYPMLALNFVFVTAMSRLVLGEHISGMRAAGIAVVVAGVSLVARS
jgi:drug/metabolite transporter (DMT)-like permease